MDRRRFKAIAVAGRLLIGVTILTAVTGCGKRKTVKIAVVNNLDIQAEVEIFERDRSVDNGVDVFLGPSVAKFGKLSGKARSGYIEFAAGTFVVGVIIGGEDAVHFVIAQFASFGFPEGQFLMPLEVNPEYRTLSGWSPSVPEDQQAVRIPVLSQE